MKNFEIENQRQLLGVSAINRGTVNTRQEAFGVIGHANLTKIQQKGRLTAQSSRIGTLKLVEQPTLLGTHEQYDFNHNCADDRPELNPTQDDMLEIGYGSDRSTDHEFSETGHGVIRRYGDREGAPSDSPSSSGTSTSDPSSESDSDSSVADSEDENVASPSSQVEEPEIEMSQVEDSPRDAASCRVASEQDDSDDFELGESVRIGITSQNLICITVGTTSYPVPEQEPEDSGVMAPQKTRSKSPSRPSDAASGHSGALETPIESVHPSRAFASSPPRVTMESVPDEDSRTADGTTLDNDLLLEQHMDSMHPTAAVSSEYQLPGEAGYRDDIGDVHMGDDGQHEDILDQEEEDWNLCDEIAEEVERQYMEQQERHNPDGPGEGFNYRSKRSRVIKTRDMVTMGLGDVTNRYVVVSLLFRPFDTDFLFRYKVARLGVDEIRDWGQTYAASMVKEALEELRKRLPPEVDIGKELIDEVTALVLDSKKYKPGDGRAFYKLLKSKTGFKSQRYDCCRENCVSFSAYPDLDKCPYPNCGLDRWKPQASGNPVTGDTTSPSDAEDDNSEREASRRKQEEKRIPYKTHVYFPIGHRIQLWYTSRYLSLLMSTYAEKAVKIRRRDLISDFWSGDIYQSLVEKQKIFKDPRDLAFCCGYDGTKPFKTRKNRYLWPIILTCLNMPPEIRFKRRNVLVAGFVPGPNNPKEDDSFLRPLIDEFQYLSRIGVKTWDEAEHEHFRAKAHLVMFSTDMPARKKLLRTMGIASSSYCEYCTIRGLHFGGQRCPHRPPENMTEYIRKEQRKKQKEGKPAYNLTKDYTSENATRRTDAAFRQVAEYLGDQEGYAMAMSGEESDGADDRNDEEDHKFKQKTGIAGKSRLMELRTLRYMMWVGRVRTLLTMVGLRFPDSFPPCTMHLFFENTVQVMFEHYAGRFFVKRPIRKRKDGTDLPPNANASTFVRGSRDAKFCKTDDPYNISPKDWDQMGKDTKKVHIAGNRSFFVLGS